MELLLVPDLAGDQTQGPSQIGEGLHAGYAAFYAASRDAQLYVSKSPHSYILVSFTPTLDVSCFRR